MANQIKKRIKIGERLIGEGCPPFIVADTGINHNGDIKKAKRMIKDAYLTGVECVKFQCHVVEDEMVPAAKKIVPTHAKESIWDIMKKCAFFEKQERELKSYTEKLGMIYLNTPFSRAAADRLRRMNVMAYKIGSGECNNYPLIKHIASFKKPIILSTGMNDIPSIKKSVKILRENRISYALLHCTSMYPTPYQNVRLGALADLKNNFPEAVIGLSDHSMGNYTCFGAVALGVAILEKHFTSSKKWSGPDIAISLDPRELRELIIGAKAVQQALGGRKDILKEEQPVINFAYACVVSTRDIEKGEKLTEDNIWVKRPGTGEIKAEEYENLLGRRATRNIKKDTQIKWNYII